ncbi:MAG: 4Fe-4S binding protein [Bacillota bacterium]
MLKKTKVPAFYEHKNGLPHAERMLQGPFALIECYQRIPCDPCQYACPREAIKTFQDINDLPEIDYDRCNGCGRCLSKCPGLAIVIIDSTFSLQEGLVKIPFEFLPLPVAGDVVEALNREGRVVCRARVLKVENAQWQDRTPVIWLTVPKEHVLDVRNLRLIQGDERDGGRYNCLPL